MTTLSGPFALTPVFSPRPWGRHELSSWYSASELPRTEEPIGEAWLTGPACVAAGGGVDGMDLRHIAAVHGRELLGDWHAEGEFPLLLKLLFPDQKLSVQVHPDDAHAQRLGQPRGKTECWYVVAAEPGAEVACGLREGVAPEQMRAAAADGSMEALLRMVPVATGDMVFVDAGTVHAIGPGVTLLETQQTSDTTYRLYDYGRPRELHLDSGIAVSRAETRAGKVAPVPIAGGTRLIQEQYFTVDRFELQPGERLHLDDAVNRPHCFTTLSGEGHLHAALSNAVTSTGPSLKRATSAVVPACCGAVDLLASTPMVVVRSMV